VLDDRVAFREDCGNIRPFGRNNLSHTGNCFRKIEHLDGAKQCLARVASPVVALTTDQTILDKSYRKAYRRKLSHRGDTAHPAAYDEDVELSTARHLPSPPTIGTDKCVWVRPGATPAPECRRFRRCGDDVVPRIAYAAAALAAEKTL
jgi:hypothetical protein